MVAVVTMATVGYGDVSPVTDTGRMIGVVVMVVGIRILSILIGAVAQRFTEPDRLTSAATIQAPGEEPTNVTFCSTSRSL